jgi:hypothetical protein
MREEVSIFKKGFHLKYSRQQKMQEMFPNDYLFQTAMIRLIALKH